MFCKKFSNLIVLATVFLVSGYAFAQKNIIVVAAPGSGKGTFSQYLVKNHNYVQICPGDLFRDEINRETKLGKQIQSIVENGKYVDENITCELVRGCLEMAIKQGRCFIIDGFPRTEYSFKVLYDFLLNNNLLKETRFVQLIARDKVCLKRILGRQVCLSCFNVFNKETLITLSQNICDNCGSGLSQRKADTRDIIIERLNYFHAYTEPLLAKFKQLYEIKTLDTECDLNRLRLEYERLII